MTYTITAPITISDSYVDARTNQRVCYKSLDGATTIRRLYVTVNDLIALPDEFFEIKASQSKDQTKAGKLAFKYLSYKLGEQPYTSFLPDGAPINLAMTPEQVKQVIVSPSTPFVQAAKEGNVSLIFNVKSPFQTIKFDGIDSPIILFDKQQFPDSNGNPDYFLRRDIELTVSLKRAVNQGNAYYQVSLASSKTPEEVFQKRQQSQVWGGSSSSIESHSDSGASDVVTPDSDIWNA